MKKHEYGRQGVYQESQDDDDDYASYGGYDYGAAARMRMRIEFF